ncbi:hydantoinase/oxoprolinase family protein [Peribacillus aracenensis]|uniref:hydantoinase/oxoprolinase family protein n=1 Tax=Peribacillus aracenensis TaxID=2976708 RepID=UPI0021A678F6|nr:hydantoinase/oxoprolinase family protein [Peribacillus sp. BBB004]
MAKYRLGIDVGGTFTDAILINIESGLIKRAKVPTTPEDQSKGTMAAIEEFGVPMEEITYFHHGYTVGLNAVLERKGAKVGLLSTQGFRDLLDMGRLLRPSGDELYDPNWIRPHQSRPIVHRRYVREVSERTLYNGKVYVELDEEKLRKEIEFLRREGIEAVGVCLINSYANLEQEQRVVNIVREMLPEAYIQSSTVHPVVGEYNRTCTVAIDAYTGPEVTKYLKNLKEKLSADSYQGQVMVMQMNGGLRTIENTIEHFPAYTLQSGPTAGLLGAEYYAKELLIQKNLICMDIGGTSTDIGIVYGGDAQITEDYEVEPSIPLGVPTIDVRCIGAGGGSLIQTDTVGSLKVGPESAGANPGPAAYGLGGKQPTVTDSYVALGYLQPELFLSGKKSLSQKLAFSALENVGDSLKMESIQLAQGSIDLMNTSIESEISKMVFERAHDLREFSLFAYGGAGPIHAVKVAKNLNIPEVIVPYFPGGFCALGMVSSRLKAERSISLVQSLDDISVEKLNEIFDNLENEIKEELIKQSAKPEDIVIERNLYGMYNGQSFDNRLALKEWPLTESSLENWIKDFHNFYEQVYGYSAPEIGIIATTINLVGYGSINIINIPGIPEGTEAPNPDSVLTTKQVYFDGKYYETKFYVRQQLLGGNKLEGPAVIDDELGTIVLIPGSVAEVDKFGSIHITFSSDNQEEGRHNYQSSGLTI